MLFCLNTLSFHAIMETGGNTMRKFSKIIIAGLLAFSLAACSGSGSGSSGSSEGGSSLFKAGTYEADADGFGGSSKPIHVKVTFSDSAIESIEYTADGETPTVGGAALPNLVDAVIAAQSTNIDGQTGATSTSNGFFAAVNDTIKQAGADPASLQPKEGSSVPAENIEETCDVVVAGAGGAGLTAAITAAQNGKKVIVLEKASVPGGNSSYATGGMNAAETHYQKEQNKEDSVEIYYEDTMKGGHNLNNPDLVRTLAENSSEAIDWLDSIGAPLPNIGKAGGARKARQHRPTDNGDKDGSVISVGSFLVEKMSAKADELGIQIITEAKVDKIIMEDGKAVGLHAVGKDGNEIIIHANAVIITTGGFGSNPDLIKKYRPDLEGYVSTNAPSVTGDAIAFLEEVGADFVDLEQIQVHPTVIQTDGALISESLRGDGAILLNKEGKRFCNELETRDFVSEQIFNQPDKYAWIVVDENMLNKSKVIKKYIDKGYMIKCDSVADLAALIGCDEAAVKESLDKWASYCALVNEEKGFYSVNDSEFGRTETVEDEMKTDMTSLPLYAAQISPGIHHCMGGVKINTNAEVIGKDGNPIPGLFAAGEVTGGVHGGNRLGGNAVADFVVFGRIAGSNASK